MKIRAQAAIPRHSLPDVQPFLEVLRSRSNSNVERSSRRTNSMRKVGDAPKTKAFDRNKLTTRRNYLVFQFHQSYQYLLSNEPVQQHKSELEQLEKLLRFPEEVARNMIDKEYEFFQQTSPVEYINFAKSLLNGIDSEEYVHDCPALGKLIHRFAEVMNV